MKETEESLRRQLRIAQQFVQATTAYLESLENIRSDKGDSTPDGLNLSSLDLRNVSPPFQAIKLLLEHVNRPLSRQEIVQALIAKGARLGAEKEKSVNQSITTNRRLGYLKEPGFSPHKRKQAPSNLVGLPEWKDSLFKN